MKKPLVLGKYLLLERVNIGGMAEVFIAKTFGAGGFEQVLAVKKILPTMAEDEEFIKMFIDEARVSVQLNHPNIVRIHDLDGKDDSYYIVMEYVSGRDLRSVLERFRRRKEIMPIPMAAYIASKMCQGLDHAHRKKDVKGMDLNIVHRDVSPQNILLGYEGEVKIIDFGIARTAIRSTRTEAGVIKGKFGYMSPEQTLGLPVDRRSDIFAAAIILYEMLTGEKLFVAESDYSTIEKVRKLDFRSPRQINANIPLALEEALMRALARKVEDRYQWASDLHEELEKFIPTEEGTFSATQLSSTLKNMFADEYTRETNKLKHYNELNSFAAETALERDIAADFRRGNGSSRTPSGQKKVVSRNVLPVETEVTQLIPAELLSASEFDDFEPSNARNVTRDAVAFSPAEKPIQLLPGAPVYRGDTVIDKAAVNVFTDTAEHPVALRGEETFRQVASVSEASKLALVDEETGLRSQQVLRLRAWLYLSSVVVGLISLWGVLGVALSPKGHLLVLSKPEDIPLEVTLKSDAAPHERRFVSMSEVIALPAGTYQMEVSPQDKSYRIRAEGMSSVPIEISKGGDRIVEVHLEKLPAQGGPSVAGAGEGIGGEGGKEGGKEGGVGPEGSGIPAGGAGGTQVASAPPEGTAGYANPNLVALTTTPPSERNTQPAGTQPGSVGTSKPGAGGAAATETFVLSLRELLDGTQVLVGGKSRGTTPALKEVVLSMPGPHRVELRKAGFERIRRTIQNGAREKTMSLSVVMRPLQPTQPMQSAAKRGKLVVSTDPNGAEIWVNGKKTAFRTPVTPSNPMLLPEGRHTLVFKSGGRQSKPFAVEITAENVAMLRGVSLE